MFPRPRAALAQFFRTITCRPDPTLDGYELLDNSNAPTIFENKKAIPETLVMSEETDTNTEADEAEIPRKNKSDLECSEVTEELFRHDNVVCGTCFCVVCICGLGGLTAGCLAAKALVPTVMATFPSMTTQATILAGTATVGGVTGGGIGTALCMKSTDSARVWTEKQKNNKSTCKFFGSYCQPNEEESNPQPQAAYLAYK